MTQDEMDLLLSLGSYDDKQAMLERQRQQAVALRNQTPVRHSSPLAAFVGGLGDAASGVTSYIAENDANNRQRDLMAQRAQARGVGARLANEAPPDISALFDPNLSDADAATKAQGLSAAIQERQKLGQLFGSTGDKTLAPMGGQMMDDSRRLQDEVIKSPQTRAQTLLSRAQASKANAEVADENGPATEMDRALFKRFGVNVEGELTHRQAKEVIGYAEKGYASDAQRAAAAAAQANARIGKEIALKEHQEQFDQKRADAQAKLLGEGLDPYKAKGGLKNYMDAINRGTKIENLLVDRNTGKLKDVIDNRQMAELAMALQALVAAGHASQTEVEHLIPKTFWGEAARAQEYFTGHPVDAGQKAFALQMLHSANLEAQTGRQQVEEALRKRLPGPYRELHGLDKARAENLVRGFDIDPSALDDDGQLRPGKRFTIPSVTERAKEANLKSKLQAGERLLQDANGDYHAAAKNEPTPPGWLELD